MLTVSRRTVACLGGLAGLIAATSACDPLHRSSPTAPPTGDAALVEQVIADVRRARDVAVADGKVGLASLHDAHLSVLGVSATATPTATATATASASAGVSAALPSSPSSPAASSAPATMAPVTSETRLLASLTAASLAAESGALARTLASMAAAVAQQIEVLA